MSEISWSINAKISDGSSIAITDALTVLGNSQKTVEISERGGTAHANIALDTVEFLLVKATNYSGLTIDDKPLTAALMLVGQDFVSLLGQAKTGLTFKLSEKWAEDEAAKKAEAEATKLQKTADGEANKAKKAADVAGDDPADAVKAKVAEAAQVAKQAQAAADAQAQAAKEARAKADAAQSTKITILTGFDPKVPVVKAAKKGSK